MRDGEFNKTYLPLADSLYRVAFHILESREDALDAVQDLYLRLWDTRDVLDSVRNPKAYCLTLVRNMCIDRVRRASAKRAEEADDNIPSGCDTERRMLDRERLDRAVGIMEKLPARQREVLNMRVFEGLSYKEISARTGIGNLSLRVMISNARRKIKSAL